MEKCKKYLQCNRWLFLSLAIIFLFVFGVYLLGKEEFVLGYDFQYQHLYFYRDFQRLVHTGQFPFWSNNLFLGTDFFSSKSYYILGDVFAYITLLFDGDHLTEALLLTTVLKLLTSALLFNHFLWKIKIKDEIRFIPVIMYTFCGWGMLFVEHPMFLVWHTFLPLLLIGVENVIQKKKYASFTFSIFLLFISNYYFFFTTSVFLTFYWTLRYIYSNPFHFKKYLIDTLTLIGYYLIGICMAMVLILPSVLHLLENKRITEALVITKKWNPIIIYLDMLVKSLIAPYQVSELGQMLFNTTEYSTNQLTLYSSVLTLLLLPQMISWKHKKKGCILALFLIQILLLLTPLGASLMHGLKEPTFRWTLLFITTEIIIFSLIFNEREKLNKMLLVSTELVIIFVIFFLRFMATQTYEVIWDHLLPEYNGLLIAFVLSILYSCILLFQKKHTVLLLGIVLSFELSYGAYKTLHRYPGFENFDYTNTISSEAIDAIKSLEDTNSFYRIYVPYEQTNASMPHNVNLYYDYKGAYTYDSLYQFSLNSFIENDLKIAPGVWQLQIQDFDLLKQLGFKYFLVKDPVFNLGKSEWSQEIIDLRDYPEFKLIQEVDGWQIWQVTDAKEFPLTLSINQDSHLLGTISSDTDKTIMIPIAYDKGWKAWVNNQEVEVASNNGFIEIPLIEGNNTVELKFLPNGFIPGLLLSTLGFSLWIIIIYKEKQPRN